MVKITCPNYYQVFQRQGNRWFGFESGQNHDDSHAATSDWSSSAIPEELTVTETELMDALFRVKGGLPGYYLANLRDRRYYYCGSKLEDVQTTVDKLNLD